MKTPTPLPQLPLPLPQRLLQHAAPGLLYTLASKAHLLEALDRCGTNIVARARWNLPAKTLLTLTCFDAATVTLSGTERLGTHCDCGLWTQSSQCPHVVTLWLQLKRLVSPESFPHLAMSSPMLLGLSTLVGIPGPTAPEPQPARDRALLLTKMGRAASSNLIRPTQSRQAKVTEKPKLRLVLKEDYGRLDGTLYFGAEPIRHWTRGLPRDIAGCLQRLPSFQGTMEYVSTFLSLTKNKYPLVFREKNGREIPLTLTEDTPRRAGFTFTLQAGRVSLSRTLDDNPSLPDRVRTAQELLLDLDAGTIQPLLHRDVWQLWDDLKYLLSPTNDFDEDFEDDLDDPEVLEVEPHRLTVTAARFNALALRLKPTLLEKLGTSVRFFHDGVPAETIRRRQPSYLLEMPASLDTEFVDLTPLLGADQLYFPFSRDLFGYFDPKQRELLSGPLRAKKRIRGLMAACLELAEAGTATARKELIKSALSGPDFLKRAVTREAKQVLTTFAEECRQAPLLLQALPDGWQFAEDDRRAQVRLVGILHELFGGDAFSGRDYPGTVTVPSEEVLSVLPVLAERLSQGGFALRMGGEPLATATWDFALDATAGTLDWFELKPEIRCDGELVTAEELQRLAAGGMLRRDGKLVLLDDLSARILAMLAGTTPSGKRKQTGEQPAIRIPRLQILDWLQLRSQGVTVRLAPADARILESLLNFASLPERPLPAALSATLRPYQRDGYHWLGFLYEHRFGACLADDMGLGKTIQGISLLAGIAGGLIATSAPAGTPHLIVVPPSLLFNWESEIARFFPTATVLTYSGPGRSTADFNRYDIVLTSYGIVQRDIEQLTSHRFNVVIFDEAQMVKNLQSATTGAARRLVGSFKLALTGTPVENRIEEYYAIMDLCLPGLLGSPEAFRRSLGNQAQGGIDTLLRRTRPFVLRRNKQLIAADLPDKIETDIHLELSPKQRVLYQRTIEEVRGEIDAAFAQRSPGQARIIALTAILRLRQICLAPALALAGATDHSPKLDFLVEQLTELRDEGHSVLVFSQFTSYLDLVEAGLKRHLLPCSRLDGSTPVPQRKQLVKNFQNSAEPTVFLISLKAGGKGLNLTRATYVYHLDPWWNPAVENQASDRAHRIGQTRQVTITRLIMRHTIEEKMMVLKEQKLKLYQAILEEGTGTGGAGLTREDFDFLLK